MADVPHLAWPFRYAGRKLVQVDQDSIEDVQQSVHAYLACPKGSRPLNPDWGVEDPTFAPSFNTSQLETDIEASEDGRAVVEVTAVGPNEYGQMDITVEVDLAE